MPKRVRTIELDGEIYFSARDIPADRDVPDDQTTEEGESHFVRIDPSSREATSGPIYERKLARWKDPTTPPKTRNKCVKMCRVGPVRTCCGWKLETRWMYRTATLQVWTKTPADVEKAIENCLGVAAIAAAVAAIITGGSAAVAIAEKLFFTCLSSKLGDLLLSVKIDTSSSWGDWS